MQENGASRTYIGREDIRRRGGRPNYSGAVNLVDVVEGNRVRDNRGDIHSMTLSKPVPEESKRTNINVRLVGNTKTEDRMRGQFRKYARTLKTLLTERGAMFTSVAVTEMYKLETEFKRELGNMKFGAFV